MERELIEFVGGIRANRQVCSFDEAAIKQAIVLKLLFLLGWDIFNPEEVNPVPAEEMPAADYALKVKNKGKALIKVVKPKEDPDRHQEKFYANAAKSGAELGILTSGTGWWFYLLQNEGGALQNRFASLDFQTQKEAEIAEGLTAFLKKDAVVKGAALKHASESLRKRRQQAARSAIPEAWSEILSGPDDRLVRLIGETVEKISGVSVEKEAIVKFLSERMATAAPSVAPLPHVDQRVSSKVKEIPAPAAVAEPLPGGKTSRKTQETPAAAAAEPSYPDEKSLSRPKAAAAPAEKTGVNYDGWAIQSFSLKGRTYRLKSWEELLVKLCEILKTQHGRDIESLQWHSVGRKYYFSKNQDELRFPAGIGQTDIFVETYLTPNETYKVALSVLAEFGFEAGDLKIA